MIRTVISALLYALMLVAGLAGISVIVAALLTIALPLLALGGLFFGLYALSEWINGNNE